MREPDNVSLRRQLRAHQIIVQISVRTFLPPISVSSAEVQRNFLGSHQLDRRAETEESGFRNENFALRQSHYSLFSS